MSRRPLALLALVLTGTVLARGPVLARDGARAGTQAPAPSLAEQTAAGRLSLDPVEMLRAVVDPVSLPLGAQTLTLEQGALLLVRSGAAPTPPDWAETRVPVGLVFEGRARLETPAPSRALALHAAAWLLERKPGIEIQHNSFVYAKGIDIVGDRLLLFIPDSATLAPLEALPPAPPAARGLGARLVDLGQRGGDYSGFVALERARRAWNPREVTGARLLLRAEGTLGIGPPGGPEDPDRWLRLELDTAGLRAPGLSLVAVAPRPAREVAALVELLRGSDVGMGLAQGDPSRADGGNPALAAAAEEALRQSLEQAEVTLLEADPGSPRVRVLGASARVRVQPVERGWTCGVQVEGALTLVAEGGSVGSALAWLPGVQGQEPPADLEVLGPEGGAVDWLGGVAPALLRLPATLEAGQQSELRWRYSDRVPATPELGCVLSVRALPGLAWAAGGEPGTLEVEWPVGAAWGPALPLGVSERGQEGEWQRVRLTAGAGGLRAGRVDWVAGPPGLWQAGEQAPRPLSVWLHTPPDARLGPEGLDGALAQVLGAGRWWGLGLPGTLDVVAQRAEPELWGGAVQARLGQGRRARAQRLLELAVGLAAAALDHGRPPPRPEEGWLRPALATAVACRIHAGAGWCDSLWKEVRRSWGRGGGFTQVHPNRLPGEAREHTARRAAAFVLGVTLPARIGEGAWWAGLEGFLRQGTPLSLEGLEQSWSAASGEALGEPFALWFGASWVPEVRTPRAAEPRQLVVHPPLGDWPIPVRGPDGGLRWVHPGAILAEGERVDGTLLLHR